MDKKAHALNGSEIAALPSQGVDLMGKKCIAICHAFIDYFLAMDTEQAIGMR